ncbi:MAG: peptidoglycan-binding protein [Candidatus Accumulibacter sp.]|jgi:peptidoglycan hydrolase-like protein with peptidoglycan-binding domain|nr:peptidoglycan-binding protein [Accumulibacter sp.]
MIALKNLTVSVCGALLLCACEHIPIPDLPGIGSGSGGSPGGAGDAAACRNLPAGAEQVRAIQQALSEQGYDPGPADGQLGPKTRDALKEFQDDVNLPETGRPDAATNAALGFCVGSAAPPAADAKIEEAQRLLAGRGYAPGPADGLMGRRTREALKRFQTDAGLPATGRADAKTLEALRAPAASKDAVPLVPGQGDSGPAEPALQQDPPPPAPGETPPPPATPAPATPPGAEPPPETPPELALPPAHGVIEKAR